MPNFILDLGGDSVELADSYRDVMGQLRYSFSLSSSKNGQSKNDNE